MQVKWYINKILHKENQVIYQYMILQASTQAASCGRKEAKPKTNISGPSCVFGGFLSTQASKQFNIKVFGLVSLRIRDLNLSAGGLI